MERSYHSFLSANQRDSAEIRCRFGRVYKHRPIPTEEMAFLGCLAKFGMGIKHGDGNTRQCMATAAVAYKQSFGFDLHRSRMMTSSNPMF